MRSINCNRRNEWGIAGSQWNKDEDKHDEHDSLYAYVKYISPPFGNENKKQINEFSVAPRTNRWRHTYTIKFFAIRSTLVLRISYAHQTHPFHPWMLPIGIGNADRTKLKSDIFGYLSLERSINAFFSLKFYLFEFEKQFWNLLFPKFWRRFLCYWRLDAALCWDSGDGSLALMVSASSHPHNRTRVSTRQPTWIEPTVCWVKLLSHSISMENATTMEITNKRREWREKEKWPQHYGAIWYESKWNKKPSPDLCRLVELRRGCECSMTIVHQLQHICEENYSQNSRWRWH